MSIIQKFIGCTLLSLFVFSVASRVAAGTEDRVTIDRDISFRRGAISATIKNKIARRTTHLYRVRARAGQEMAIVLKTGGQTSATLYAPTEGIVEGADGVRRTLVTLSETGEYLIQIGTDANAVYALEVTIH